MRKKPSGACPSGTRNHLDPNFNVATPNTKWVTDYSVHSHGRALAVPLCRPGFIFGLVVGWSMSPRQDRQLVFQAVLMAVWQHPARTAVILHSDQGCQFTSEEYQQFLEAQQVICSMSAVGSCADNAAAESFFGVLTRGRVNWQHYQTRAEARADIFEYIERSPNPRQRRRLDMQQQGEQLFTQPSMITG